MGPTIAALGDYETSVSTALPLPPWPALPIGPRYGVDSSRKLLHRHGSISTATGGRGGPRGSLMATAGGGGAVAAAAAAAAVTAATATAYTHISKKLEGIEDLISALKV